MLYNGNIITLNENETIASALAVNNDKISKIGDYEEIRNLLGKNTKKVDLENKTVIPGFIDSHIHLISLGLAMQVIDLREINSKTTLLFKIKEKVKETPPKHWIKGYGFNETKINELPNRYELDKISPKNPIYLEDIDSKTCIINSIAIKTIKINHNMNGVKVEINKRTGELTGLIKVEDQKLLYEVVRIPTIDPVDETLEESELERAIEIASEKAIRVGITSIHDLQLPPKGIRAFKKAVCNDKTPLRVYIGCDRNKDIELQNYIDEGLGTEPYSNRVKIGIVKLFADGRMPITEFKRRVIEAHRLGYQLAIHSSDNEQVKNSLEALEDAAKMIPFKDNRHRIEHAYTINKNMIERIKNLDLFTSSQPETIFKIERKFPENVLIVPLGSLIKKGVTVVGGSDSPTLNASRRAIFPRTFPNPLVGLSFEVFRKTEKGITLEGKESISFLEALKMHTINGAHASFEEKIKGTLEEGKLADLVVLSENPFEIDSDRIKDIKVEMTIIGGKIVYNKNCYH